VVIQGDIHEFSTPVAFRRKARGSQSAGWVERSEARQSRGLLLGFTLFSPTYALKKHGLA
jgi:hypothetical protein